MVDDWEDEAEITGGQEKEAGDDWEEDWESCVEGVSRCLNSRLLVASLVAPLVATHP